MSVHGFVSEKDHELRSFRKTVTDMEEQIKEMNEKIASIKDVFEKLQAEKEQEQTRNLALENHLGVIRSLLADHFSSFPLQDTNEVATLETIDHYMTMLHRNLLEQSAESDDETFISSVRQIVMNLDSGQSVISQQVET